MASLIGSIFSGVAETSADKTISFSSASAAAASAHAYLSATLEASTPEVRRLFQEYATQSVMGHEAIMGLMLKKGWANPYESPDQQVQTVLNASNSVIGQQH